MDPASDRLTVRVPEPDLMDDPGQAAAYAAADFSAAHDTAVARFRLCFPSFAARAARVVDLGCGPADVTVRFATAHPLARIDGVDGAGAMIALGRERVAAAGLAGRVSLHRVPLPAAPSSWGGTAAGYDAVISSSLLHHLDDPAVLWQAVVACARPGAAVFVWDLARPSGIAAVDALVRRYGAGDPPVLRRDFRNSLLAAYRPDEVEAQLRRARLPLTVEAVGDRHLVVWGTRP